MFIEIISAVLLGLLNGIISIFVLKKNKRKEISEFKNVILLSLLIRFFFMLIIIWICLSFLGFNAFYFGITLITTTFLFIIFEILFINNRTNFLNLQNGLIKKV